MPRPAVHILRNVLQILGFLGQALVLQVLALPVLPPFPVAPGGSEQASVESRLVQMLLHQAIPQATADMSGKLQAVQQHNDNPNECPAAALGRNHTHSAMGDCVAAAGSILSNPTINQLLQLLEQLQLRHGQLAALQVRTMSSKSHQTACPVAWVYSATSGAQGHAAQRCIEPSTLQSSTTGNFTSRCAVVG